ncbi:hypothetical protein [Desulfobacula phenolica]|uniref:Uncharacterized protein n=1 Tax=Desulfobacula phenolica TaxID=90732 RepID=A0A1H2GFN6_9BACT|nr:hypothetical protein [Desulfobacula phenolica]SDU18380.1 hypothetical protein SAMN04487931_105177 [Desulfobacula phenolica]
MRFEKTDFEVIEKKNNKLGRLGFKQKLTVTSLSLDICAKPEGIAKKNVKTAKFSSKQVIYLMVMMVLETFNLRHWNYYDL